MQNENSKTEQFDTFILNKDIKIVVYQNLLINLQYVRCHKNKFYKLINYLFG